jgi:hypothetical protein
MANRFQDGLRKLKEEATPSLPPIEEARPKTPVPPTREGKKVISGYFDPAVKRQFAQIALNDDLSHQQVLVPHPVFRTQGSVMRPRALWSLQPSSSAWSRPGFGSRSFPEASADCSVRSMP